MIVKFLLVKFSFPCLHCILDGNWSIQILQGTVFSTAILFDEISIRLRYFFLERIPQETSICFILFFVWFSFWKRLFKLLPWFWGWCLYKIGDSCALAIASKYCNSNFCQVSCCCQYKWRHNWQGFKSVASEFVVQKKVISLIQIFALILPKIICLCATGKFTFDHHGGQRS